MKAVKIYSKKINKTLDGRICTPYFKVVYFHGNILFKRGFVKPMFNITDSCLHIFGFRFTKGII